MSVADDLLAAGVAVVDAAAAAGGWRGAGVTYPVLGRKVPEVTAQDPDQLAVVSVAEDGFEPATADDAAAWYGHYTVTVLLAQRTAAATDRGGVKARRQQVRRAVTLPALQAAGCSACDDCDPAGGGEFDPSQLDAGRDYSAVVFKVRTLEPR